MSRAVVVFVLLSLACLPGCSLFSPTIRVATFNTALSRDKAGELHAALAKGDDLKAKRVAEVLQRTRPDVVLLQEVDYDPTGKAYKDFQRNYLSESQNGAKPIAYKYVYAPPVNTGVLAPVDLDGDGQVTSPNDCFGFGRFPGHYGMVVLSKYPIQTDDIASFREALWKNMPSNSIPLDYYSPTALSRLRLSSKTHAIVPVSIGLKRLDLMISHPTPPVFDGPEDRNGRRNYDEIGLWYTYLTNGFPRKRPSEFPRVDGTNEVGRYSLGDDASSFVIMGDLNADPNDGESRPGAIQQLLEHARINASVTPTSQGAIEAAKQQGGKNLSHQSDPAGDTADFGDKGNAPGNLRVDYVLPSNDLNIVASGVYWPTADDPHAYLNKASDHKLVWIDLRLP